MKKEILQNNVIVIFCFCIATLFANAQKYDRTIKGFLYDKVTGQKVEARIYDKEYDKLNVTVYCPNGDTLKNNGWWSPEQFSFNVAKEGGKYTIEISLEGFEQYSETINLKPFKNTEKDRDLHNILLTRIRKQHQLNGVDIKASKVKFYHRGDTLIYDADAFDTPDGSMLEDLIKKLPGVELKQGGEITVNGKRIDALLLNGEAIFNNKNELLLENLPNYMIKDIKIYDKESEESRIMQRNMGNNEYVMDVKLKKQYCKGLIGNIEAGYGSNKRYLMRLFGLRFTDFSRLTFYANLNNLNDNRNPGENDSWSPEKMPRGLVSRKKAGFNYLIKKRMDLWKAEGGVDAMLSSTDNYQRSTKEQFLPTGSLYTKAMIENQGKYNSVNTYHTISFFKKGFNLKLSPKALYNEIRNNGTEISATFDNDPEAICKTSLFDSIKQIGNSDLLRTFVLNRMLRESKSESKTYSIGIEGSSFIKLGSNSLMLSLNAENKNSESKLFSHTLYDYPQSGNQSDFRNLYVNDKPNRNIKINCTTRYIIPISTIENISLLYDYGLHEESRNNEQNLLNRLTDWQEAGSHALGTLPSEVEYRMTTIDAENSYDKHEIRNDNSFTLEYERWPNSVAHDINIVAKATVKLSHDRLNYYRGNGFDQTIYSGITHKNFVLQNYSLRVDLPKGKNNRSHPILYYKLNQTAPSLLSMLEDFSNTSDPLNISTGNSNLKVTTEHDIQFEWRGYFGKNRNLMVYLLPQWAYTSNALAYGSTYNTTTGVRHYRPENVNGNHRTSLKANASLTFGKKKQWTLNVNSDAAYLHGVDLVSSGSEPTRSIVNTVWNKDNVRLTRQFGKHTLGFNSSFGISRSTSKRENFNAFTLYDFNYGITADIRLPWNLRLSTDLTMFSRRGYADNSANTNDLVWNARLTKSIPNTNLIVMIDAFDILNQLSNVTQIVNSQGRTEIYHNALPRYVMAHVIYKLSKQPAKKKR